MYKMITLTLVNTTISMNRRAPHHLSTMPVSKVFARQIFDSRGNPTVEVDVETEKGKFSFGEFLLAHNQGFL